MNDAVKTVVRSGLIFVFVCAVAVATAVGHAEQDHPIKKSRSGICHCPGGQYYDRTTKLTPFRTIDECLSSGGRHPKRGQGDCMEVGSIALGSSTTQNMELDADTIRPSVRIIDGDTIDLNGTRIRLQGVDTPETRQSCRDADGQLYSCGLVATAALTVKIGEGDVHCDLEPERDRYGRALKTCYLADGTDINGWLVRNGYGLAYLRYSERYVAEEAAARAEDLGMHAGAFVPPWDWRKGERLQ